MSLAQGFPSTFSDTQKTNEVLHNLDNETKKIYNDVNAFMAADGHAHTGNGSDGAILNITPATLNVIPIPASIAQGDIIYRGASVFERLPAGTSGQLLKTLGIGANPVWVDSPLSGGKGIFRNLKIQVTSNALATVTLDYACLYGGAEITALSETLNKETIGAVNGLDTGTIANSTWYYVYAIAKADGTKGVLMSLSDTAPTMPSGYIDKIRLGAIRTHSDGTLLKTIQSDRKVQYVTQSSGNTLVYPVMASGVSGTITTTVYTPIAVAVANFIPPTAGKIQTIIGNTLATGGNFIACSPNANFPNGVFATGTTAAPISAAGSAGTTANGTMVLETTNIYWACNFASGRLACIGWEDNL